MYLLLNPYSFDEINPEEIKPDVHGRTKVRAKIMKVGKLPYLTPDGKLWYGNVTLEALEKAKESIAFKPVTIGHPPDLLSSKDIKKYTHGVSADNAKIEEIDGETWLTNDLILHGDEAINTARAGKLGVSAGYYRKAIPTGDGTFNFDDPDINHIAFGAKNPRASGAGIYSLDDADSDYGKILEAKQQNPKKEVKRMKQTLRAVEVGAFSMDEVPIEYDEEKSQGAIKVLEDREKKLVKQLKVLTESMDEMEKKHKDELGEATGSLKVLEKKNKELEEKLENSISMDEAKEKLAELAKIKESCDWLGVSEDFTTAEEGMRLVVEADSPGISFDDSEIPGAYKKIVGAMTAADKKRLAEKQKSDKALKNQGKSMDDKVKVSISQLDIGMIRKGKQLLAHRRA